jgi:hypothetical protein
MGRIALFPNSERWHEISPPLSFDQVRLRVAGRGMFFAVHRIARPVHAKNEQVAPGRFPDPFARRRSPVRHNARRVTANRAGT